jgi:hypothetical protein
MADNALPTSHGKISRALIEASVVSLMIWPLSGSLSATERKLA